MSEVHFLVKLCGSQKKKKKKTIQGEAQNYSLSILSVCSHFKTKLLC